MKQPLRASTDSMIGSVLLGRYRVVRELAKGGMGVVYLARAEGAVGFVKPVVIKLLLPEHAQDDRFVGMFVREAQILSQLRHPSLVDVVEFGEEDDAYVLILEYVRGYHLGQWLRFLSLKKREAPADILIQIVIDALEALHHAHKLQHPDGSSMQIVHRDVSPSNILLDQDGRGRLLDFGVARMRGGANDYKTQVKGFMGKLPYTAPELFANQEASPRSDLYACAVVLHEALYGSNVFRTEMQAATLHKVMTHIPEPVERARSGVPAGLDAVLARALVKAPAERYSDAREFATALRRLQCEQESEIRAHLAALLEKDFGPEMAQLLNLESLAHRDEAWRQLSQAPARMPTRKGERAADGRTASDLNPLPVAPAALGATVASPRGQRQAANVVVDVQLENMAANDSAAPKHGREERRSDGATRMIDEPVMAASAARAEERSAALARGLPDPGELTSENTHVPSRRPTGQRGMFVGLCVVGLLALVAIALVLFRAPAPVPVAPKIRVVALPSDPDPVPTTSVTPVPPNQPAVETPLLPTAATPDPPDRPRGEPRRPKTGTDAQALTLALRRQQPRLEACFKQHSVSLEGQPTTQLEFDLDAAGKALRVGLAPRALAATPLGECLLQIGRTTTFPAPGNPVSFAIPLTARRAPGG